MAHYETKLTGPRYWARRVWQRLFTRLPRRIRPFEALFPPHCGYLGGVFAARPIYTGVLRREPGRPFAVRPTRYILGVGAGLAAENAGYVTAEPERMAYAMAEGCVYGNHGRVHDPLSRSFIAETCEEWDTPFSRHSTFAMPGFPPPQRLAGTSLLLTSLGGQTFCHFFLETLPKAIFARDLLPACDHILVSRYGEPWKRRWLALFGLDERIRFIDELTHLQCDQVVFTNRLVRHFEASPWAVRSLRRLPGLELGDDDPPGRKRLWLDRSRSPMRKVSWETGLVAALPGITPVDAETLAPAEAVGQFRQASALVGFHGAGLCNMVFCPRGTRIVEIFTRSYYPWYARLAQACGHDHVAIVVDDEAASIGPAAAAIARALAFA